jgi:uncharacterized protein (TIGR03435 family)
VALEVSGDAVGYASALAELEAWRAGRSPFALAATGGSLLVRIRRLLGEPRAARHQPPAGALIAALIVALIGAGSAFQYVALAGDRQAGDTLPDITERRLERIEWRSIQTEHFDLLVPPGLVPRADDVGRRAERAYATVTGDLQHEPVGRIHLVLFESRDTMERLSGGALLPPFGADVVIRLALDRDDGAIDASLVHEMTHMVQANILGTADAPIWLTEGLAEHELGEWSTLDQGRLAGLVRNERVPTLRELVNAPADTATAYAVGHAVLDFVDDLRGKAGVRSLLASVRDAGRDDAAGRYARAIGLTPDSFDAAFREYLADRVGPIAQSPGATNPPGSVPALALTTVRPATDASLRFQFTNDRLRVAGATARDLIRFAYGLEADSVTGGPDWLDRDRFDVETAGDGDGAHLGSPALRAVLEERFHLTLRAGTVPVDGLAVTLAGSGQLGPRLKRSSVDCAADAHRAPVTAPRERSLATRLNFGPIRCGTHVLASAGRAEGNGVPLAMLARSLEGPLGAGAIVDMTGLKGAFDYLLEFTPFTPASLEASERARARAATRASIETAMRQQLGLALMPRTTTQSVIVVERVDFPVTDPVATRPGAHDVLAFARSLLP